MRWSIDAVPAWPASPVKRQFSRLAAVNRLHHAERQPRLLQARPLLDMQFQIGGDIPRVTGRVGDPRRIESGIHQRLGDAHPVGIAL